MRYADSRCSYKEALHPHRYLFRGPCIKCKEIQNVTVLSPELYAYRTGNSIQTALKSVNADDREFLITGICGSCWKIMFHKAED